jgi:hypothetical protein
MIAAEGQGLQNLTDAERFEFARHLCALQVRNPRIIRDQLAPAVARPSQFPSWLSPGQLKEMKEFEPRFRAMFNSNYDLSKFASHLILNDIDKDAEILIPKDWIVLQTHPPYGSKSLYITGELPFISTHDIASPESIYIFPMTPSVGLVIHKDLERLLKLFELNKPWGFAHLNLCIVSNNREVYFRNPGHKKFIDRFLGSVYSLPEDPAEAQRFGTQLYVDFYTFMREYFIDLGLEVPPLKTPQSTARP